MARPSQADPTDFGDLAAAGFDSGADLAAIMRDFLLVVHILAAAAWIGGSLFADIRSPSWVPYEI
jgi:hypothetical protein